MTLAPLPWKIDRESEGKHWTDSISIVDAEGGEVCVLTRGYQGDRHGGCPSWQNAEAILAAVNKTDSAKLRTALEELLPLAENAIERNRGTPSSHYEVINARKALAETQL